MHRPGMIALLLISYVSSFALAATDAPVATPEQKVKIATLRHAALTGDDAGALAACRELATLGPAAEADLLMAIRQRVAREESFIERGPRPYIDIAKVATAEESLTALRKSSLETIAGFPPYEEKKASEAAVKIAHDNQVKLQQMNDQLSPVLAMQVKVIESAARRKAWMDLLDQANAEEAKKGHDASDAKMNKMLEKLTGLSLDDAVAIPPFGEGKDPAEGTSAWYIWFYRASRLIEAYNKAFQPLMSQNEWDNVVFINPYRETLGILPLEVDARLIQQARREAKDKIDTPLLGPAKPADLDAGYAHIMNRLSFTGPSRAKDATDLWLKLTPVHKMILDRRATAIGVGKWRDSWALVFGSDPRVMTLPKAQRDKIKIKGKIMPPETK